MAGNVETKERAIQYREILVKATVEKMNEIIGLLKDGRYEDVEKFIMPVGDSGSHVINFGDGFDIKDTIVRLKELKGMIDRPVSGILDRSIPIAPDGSVEYNGNRYILVQDTDLHPAYGMLSCDRCVFKGKYGLCKKPQYFPLSCVSSDNDIVSHFEKITGDKQDTEMDRETSKKIEQLQRKIENYRKLIDKVNISIAHAEWRKSKYTEFMNKDVEELKKLEVLHILWGFNTQHISIAHAEWRKSKYTEFMNKDVEELKKLEDAGGGDGQER